MLQVFNFEDDSLPKVRRALMFVASLLVLTIWLKLRLDLSGGKLRSENAIGFDTANFDPAFVLIPILVYLVFRALATAIWYLPLSKVEHTAGDPKFRDLATALREYTQEAERRSAYLAPAKELNIPQVNELAKKLNELKEDVGKRLDELDHNERMIENQIRAYSDYDADEGSDKRQKEISEIVRALRATHEKCQTQDRFLAELARVFSGLETQTGTMEKLKGEVTELNRLVNSNIGSNKLRAVVSAFGSLNSDLVVAAGRKAWIEFWFGLVLPLCWALFALWFAGSQMSAIALTVYKAIRP